MGFNMGSCGKLYIDYVAQCMLYDIECYLFSTY